MPLRVFDGNGDASVESILRAMNYAIDHGADIINLSIGGTQFKYIEKFDATIRRAFDK